MVKKTKKQKKTLIKINQEIKILLSDIPKRNQVSKKEYKKIVCETLEEIIFLISDMNVRIEIKNKNFEKIKNLIKKIKNDKKLIRKHFPHFFILTLFMEYKIDDDILDQIYNNGYKIFSLLPNKNQFNMLFPKTDKILIHKYVIIALMKELSKLNKDEVFNFDNMIDSILRNTKHKKDSRLKIANILLNINGKIMNKLSSSLKEDISLFVLSTLSDQKKNVIKDILYNYIKISNKDDSHVGWINLITISNDFDRIKSCVDSVLNPNTSNILEGKQNEK